MGNGNITGKVKHVAIRVVIVTLINLAIACGICWIQRKFTMKNYSTALTYLSFIYLLVGPATLVGQDSARRDAINMISSSALREASGPDAKGKVTHVNFTVKMVTYGVVSLLIAIALGSL